MAVGYRCAFTARGSGLTVIGDILVYVAVWGVPFVTALIFGRSWVLLVPVVASSLWATAGSLGWFPVGGDFNLFYAIFPMLLGIVFTGTGLLIRQLFLNAIAKRPRPRT